MLRPYNFEEVRRRVRERLAALGNPAVTTLATRYGLDRNYIRDIIADQPRKKQIKSDKLNALAAALQCDPEYLTLSQVEPRRSSNGRDAREPLEDVEFLGFLEANSWRPPESAPLPDIYRSVLQLPRIDGVSHLVGIMRGNDMAEVGFSDGMLIIAQQSGATKYAPGSLVIARRRKQDLVEMSAREIRRSLGRTVLTTRPSGGEPHEVESAAEGVEILGLITHGIHVAPHGRV